MDPNVAVFVAAASLFVVLATLLLGLFAWLRADLRRMEERTNLRLDRLDLRFDRLETRLAAVEHGQAKLEGLLEGLREAISGRVRHTAAE